MSLVHIVEQGNLTKNEKRQVKKNEAAYERKKSNNNEMAKQQAIPKINVCLYMVHKIGRSV